jgi:predicted secreted Zn-dependent protease
MRDLAGAVWRKSTRSGGNDGSCVEVAFLPELVAVRDSKNPTGPALAFTPAEWDAFTAGVKDNEFDRV